MKQNKIAGFWIRLAARGVDTILFAILVVVLSYFLLDRLDGQLQFAVFWKFYLWNILAILFLLILFIFIPTIFNGQTIGMLVFSIQILFSIPNNKVAALIKRELFVSLVWFMNLVMLLILVNHTLINKLITQQEVSYSLSESLRIGLFTTLASMLLLLQWLFAFSVMIRKDKIGWHDHLSNSRTVYKHKFQVIKKTTPLVSFKPFLIKNKKVEWIN